MSTLSNALNRLLASAQPLQASDFTPKQRKQLEQFARDTRHIVIGKQGNSTLYRVINRQSLRDFLMSQHPLANDPQLASVPPRSRNIGLERNSKQGQMAHACLYLLMKAWDASVVWQNDHTGFYPAELTEIQGVAALQIRAGQRWQSNGPLLLVENQALFDRHDWLPENFNGSLAYYAGQLSEVLLQWLAEHKRCNEAILFPDYDGIGLSNYVRLAQSLHSDSSLHFFWLPSWQRKLEIFGNAGLWLKTRTQFVNALDKLKAMNALENNFIELGHLAQRYGKALEQEAIWLNE